jgi:hemerythrin-like domain-containing protein
MTGSLSPTAAAADVVSNAAGKGAGVDKLIQVSRFVDAVVDFIRVYADRTYHGREEDILFRDLEKKNLSDDDRRVMNELL